VWRLTSRPRAVTGGGSRSSARPHWPMRQQITTYRRGLTCSAACGASRRSCSGRNDLSWARRCCYAGSAQVFSELIAACFGSVFEHWKARSPSPAPFSPSPSLVEVIGFSFRIGDQAGIRAGRPARRLPLSSSRPFCSAMPPARCRELALAARWSTDGRARGDAVCPISREAVIAVMVA